MGLNTDVLIVDGVEYDLCRDQLTDLKEDLKNISGISDGVKNALLQIASKVAYIDDDGQDYYDALYDALYPSHDLDSITAVYTQSGGVYETTSLDSLKPDLVVTAHYTDSTTEPVTNYILSGELTIGTSSITVSYGGKTTTFSVMVTEQPIPAEYQQVEWVGFDGNSRIVTSATGDMSHSYDAKIQFDGSAEECVFGICEPNAARIEVGKANNENRVFLYTSNSLSISDITGLLDYPMVVNASYDFSSGNRTRSITATVNNVEYTNTDSYGEKSVSSDHKLVIGSAGYNSQRYSFSGKVYYLKYFIAGTLACDVVPCYRISDGVIGMYDKVAQAFYTNSGSGTLTKGADVNVAI